MNSTVASVSWLDYCFGISMLTIGCLCFSVCSIVAVGTAKAAKQRKGFRIFVSDAIANLGQMVMFGIWPGLITLLGRNLLPQTEAVILCVTVANNALWFCMCNHYTLMAISRFCAVVFPIYYRTTFVNKLSVLLSLTWLLALLQAVYLSTRPWWAVFYYNPHFYGLTTDDWALYGGTQATFWAFYHAATQLLPVCIYVCAAAVLFKRRNAVQPVENESAEREKKREKRLLIPCAVNQSFYAFGAGVVFKLIGVWDLGLGRAAAVLFNCYATINSVVNSLLLFAMSTPLRTAVKQLFGAPHAVVQRPQNPKKIAA